MTPQELMDLPGSGKAEKQLRIMGMWKVCINDTERLDWIAENTVSAKCDFDTWSFTRGQTNIDAEFIRDDIDNASSIGELT